MNVNAEIEIDVSELASELVFESEFTDGVVSVMQDKLGDYVGGEVDRYMTDHIEDVVCDVLRENPELFRGLVAKALGSIAQDTLTY